jgi:hypothetical protein
MPAVTCHPFPALAAEVSLTGYINLGSAPGAFFKDCSTIHFYWALYFVSEPRFFFTFLSLNVSGDGVEQTFRSAVRTAIDLRLQPLR